MARAFWFSLLIGYLAGAFAAAIYLPRAILAPSLSNLFLLTGFSALFVIVVSWRAWRERGQTAPPETPPKQQRQRQAEEEPSELLLAEPVHLHESRKDWRTSHDPDEAMLDEVPLLAPETEARLKVRPAEPHSRQRSRRRPPEKDKGLVCLASPLVQLPQRRKLGQQIIPLLVEDDRRFDRQGLVNQGLDEASILEFDRAVCERTIQWMEQDGHVGAHGSLLMLDLRLNALRSRKSRGLIDQLVSLADYAGLRVNLVIDGFTGRTLPKLRADIIGGPVDLFYRADGVIPGNVEESGFRGVCIDRAVFGQFLDYPLSEDPMFRRLDELAKDSIRIVMQGLAHESELRDVFDYPCDWASGSLFGEAIRLSSTAVAGHHDRPVARSHATGGGFDQLRGQMGYGVAAELTD